jgi:hypothetical protein
LGIKKYIGWVPLSLSLSSDIGAFYFHNSVVFASLDQFDSGGFWKEFISCFCNLIFRCCCRWVVCVRALFSPVSQGIVVVCFCRREKKFFAFGNWITFPDCHFVVDDSICDRHCCECAFFCGVARELALVW